MRRRDGMAHAAEPGRSRGGPRHELMTRVPPNPPMPDSCKRLLLRVDQTRSSANETYTPTLAGVRMGGRVWAGGVVDVTADPPSRGASREVGRRGCGAGAGLRTATEAVSNCRLCPCGWVGGWVEWRGEGSIGRAPRVAARCSSPAARQLGGARSYSPTRT